MGRRRAEVVPPSRALRIVFATAFSAALAWTPKVDAQEPDCALVPVEGAAVHTCQYPGEGPTIVFAAGAGQHSATWAPILAGSAEMARVITFDRPGLGRSPAADGERSPSRIATELREVLEALDATEEVILVGHSMGGVHALRYATSHPRDVVGVVLIDTPPPGFERARMTLLSPAEQAERRRLLEEGASRAPPIVRLERQGAEDDAEWDFTDFPRAVPLTVIIADSQDFGAQGSLQAQRELWIERSAYWSDRSAESSTVVATGSGHMVHHERPDLVLAAIAELLERIDARH